MFKRIANRILHKKATAKPASPSTAADTGAVITAGIAMAVLTLIMLGSHFRCDPAKG